MHSSLVASFLVLAAIAQAAPIVERKEKPDTYFEGYLEDYLTYHTRYLAIGCSKQHGTQFFDDCCRPMLATETLEENRLPYCRPNATESVSASSYVAEASATPTASADIEAASAYSGESASVAEYVSSASELPSASSIDVAKAFATSTSEWVAPSTTEEAAPAETQAPASSGGNMNTGGHATFFYQNGNPGACGQYHSDSEYGVAIDSNGYWQGSFGTPSDHCGKQVHITNTNNGKSVTATVWDVCPTCVSDNSLDLSVAAFNAIASESEGMVPIEWTWA